MIVLKSKDQIEIMHEANAIVHAVLEHVANYVQVGISTKELDALAEDKMNEYHGATSAFKGYHDYPAVSCISVNEEVVHGIPGSRVLKSGDIVSVDFGVYYKGFAGDSARSFLVGDFTQDIKKLNSNTLKALMLGISKMVPGNRLYDISLAIESIAIDNNYGNVRGFSGHGIGCKMHEQPSVFNYIEPRQPNVRLREGMVLALEPMFCIGDGDVSILEDGWTVVTKDNKQSCHWELSAAITSDGPRILGEPSAFKTSL